MYSGLLYLIYMLIELKRLCSLLEMVILGKSQIKKLAEHLVGYDNVSSIDLGKLCERFGASAVYQKRLAGCNDMSYQSIKDMSIFKQLTRWR